MKRTLYCGKVRIAHQGQTVILCGWVHSRRDHGGLIFWDVRDREGLVQVVFRPENKEVFGRAERVGLESVVEIRGKVLKRPPGTENRNLPTGEIEVEVDQFEVLNTAKPPPFEVSEFSEAGEDIRLRYRFLDLRRPPLQRNLRIRHEVSHAIRASLVQQGFLEVETPFLTKSTPEGARDFLVPARLSPGHFYALPQSPQLFKQLLMVSGFDKYFQIVRCFRDEDLRADRQPEFTQVDLEMSFVDPEDVMSAVETFVVAAFEKAVGRKPALPFPRMGYDEAMSRYGSDAPDTRYALNITDLTDLAVSSGFNVFSKAVAAGGTVRAIAVPGGAQFSRQKLDQLTQWVNTLGGKGLAWWKCLKDGVESPIAKFFQPAEIQTVREKTRAREGDILFFAADQPALVFKILGQLRQRLARELNLKPEGMWNFCWVEKFPLLEWDADLKRWAAVHHPFTSPRPEDWDVLEKAPVDSPDLGRVRALAYDLVLNGVEIGGGSIRIHRKDRQELLFRHLQFNSEQARSKFGFLLEALEHGAPPHGGFALGLDRFTALLAGEESIRDVIAFPKTQKGADLLSGAPAEVSETQLKELGLRPAAPAKKQP